MKKLENLLKENMRRFGTKNLKENAFQGEPVEPDDDTVTIYQSKFDMVNLKVDGRMQQLLWMDKGKTLQQVLDLAKEEDAYIPTIMQLDSLQKSIKPGETVGDIWVDQKGQSAEFYPPHSSDSDSTSPIQYKLFNLSNNSDVVVQNNSENNIQSEHVVLLRSTPMKRPVTVTPKTTFER